MASTVTTEPWERAAAEMSPPATPPLAIPVSAVGDACASVISVPVSVVIGITRVATRQHPGPLLRPLRCDGIAPPPGILASLRPQPKEQLPDDEVGAERGREDHTVHAGHMTEDQQRARGTEE